MTGRRLTQRGARGVATLLCLAGAMASSAGAGDLVVTTLRDEGKGSLRQAILDANANEGPDVISFDAEVFAEPQTIVLSRKLPDLQGELTINGYIEDRLWRATGVTVSGGDDRRVFRVVEGARITIESLTVADGRAGEGAGISNAGTLIVKGVTFLDNAAKRKGGGLANIGGELIVVNSTFARNRAGNAGGGLANVDGSVTVTNSTFSQNGAKQGGALASEGLLLLRNTILANSTDESESDCFATGSLESGSGHNLIEQNDGCGTPISTGDPVLEPLGYFNGPTQTFPLRSGSPAINLGDNDLAVDENGEPLVWDQRGNGDPRFVAGFTDIGAFEQQAFPSLVVDTPEDTNLRACTRVGQGDCPLRAAIQLANATEEADTVTFDPRVFATERTIILARPLPPVATPIALDAGDLPEITIRQADGQKVFEEAPDGNLQLRGIRVEGEEEPNTEPTPRDTGE